MKKKASLLTEDKRFEDTASYEWKKGVVLVFIIFMLINACGKLSHV